MTLGGLTGCQAHCRTLSGVSSCSRHFGSTSPSAQHAVDTLLLGISSPQMVHTLASNGANSIWEHSLLDPAQVQSGRRKANPQDKVQ